MADLEIEKIIADIIKTELSLADSRVFIYNQDFKIPNVDDLFIVVGLADSKVISNRSHSEANSSGGLDEVQETYVRENIKIDIFSKNSDARVRRYEVLQALASVYSQQQQEKNDIKIAQMPTNFINTSAAEGAGVINRYTAIVPCLVWYRKTKQVSTGAGYDYYDKFPFGGIIEEKETIFNFEITEDTEL